MSLNPKLRHWQNRTVWIIGASSGIGLATASALHAAGATVVVSARSVDALQGFVQAHPGSIALPFDASDRISMARAAQKLISQAGRLDLVMYCAGYYRAMPVTAFNLDEALRHQQVNVNGALYMLDAILPRCETVVTTQSLHPRAATAEELKALIEKYDLPVLAIDKPEDALAQALSLAGHSKGILITGSIFIAAAARSIWQEMQTTKGTK